MTKISFKKMKLVAISKECPLKIDRYKKTLQ